MKRMIALSAIMLGIFCVAGARNPDENLPTLHKIQSATLSPSYSCRNKDDFRKGYAGTALFLSKYSEERNSPELLFNGACRSEDYFEGSTAGDDMSLIADLGDIPLEGVTAQMAFNPKGVVKHDSIFAMNMPVLAHHTYALLINKSSFRGLAVFRVEEYLPNKSVKLRYAVKEYQLVASRTQSDGFTWDAKNSN